MQPKRRNERFFRGFIVYSAIRDTEAKNNICPSPLYLSKVKRKWPQKSPGSVDRGLCKSKSSYLYNHKHSIIDTTSSVVKSSSSSAEPVTMRKKHVCLPVWHASLSGFVWLTT
ncbi:MAG: hypothetical protein UY62_C0089G0007 [Parcubacteria group bacterium GW2011_GWF2_50_9]|nr:MAG: hypothetical protein UY62_C0089G0007 [Parcubacteria group bacterium GW2011_GWF2_50_9]